MNNKQKNYLINVAMLILVMAPLVIHLVNNMSAGVAGPDLIYKIIYGAIFLWGVWAAPKGKLYWEFFDESDVDANNND